MRTLPGGLHRIEELLLGRVAGRTDVRNGFDEVLPKCHACQPVGQRAATRNPPVREMVRRQLTANVVQTEAGVVQPLPQQSSHSVVLSGLSL